MVSGDVTPRGPVKNKVLVMSSGEWLAPGRWRMIDTGMRLSIFLATMVNTGSEWIFRLPIIKEGASGA